MDSDSDSDFVSFGTPLEIIEEDEPLPKPISVQDQVVHDRQGRQRFHGAFTGGFSAGFFNTVGSKEGFTPSTFVSSRGKKADQHDHKPEDYMDEDDKGEYGIAPRKLVTTQRFAGEEVGSKKRPAPDVSIIPDDGRIQDIIKPTDETSGARLLRRMGWKPGQGVGPKMERKKKGKTRKKKKGGDDGKVYGCARPPILEPQGDDEDEDEDDKEHDDESPNEDSDEEDFMRGFLFAPDDIQDFMFALKDDQHGIGYQGMDSRSILGGHVTLFDDPVMKQNRRQGIKGSAFGIGAFEDEEESDVYSSDRMSNYDRVLGGEEEKQEKRMYGWTGPPPQRSSDADVLDGFKGASQKKISTKVFQPPTLPRDFRPFHRFETTSGETPDLSKPEPQTHSRFTLSADQRAGMLGEEQLPGPTSIDELLTSRDLALLKDARDKASTRVQGAPQHQSRWDRGAPSWSAPTQEAMPQGGGSGFQPFAKDAEKQHRYDQYLQNRHKGPEMAAVDSRTEWEKQQEIEEFSRAASLYHKPMSGLMASRFVRAKHTDDADDTQEAPAETERDVNDQCKAAEMKMFGQLTRDTMEWHPDKLLCKRFNVADPYPESSIVGPPTVKKDKFSVFNFLEIQQPASAQMDIYPTQPGLSKLVSTEVEEPRQSSSSSSSLKRSRWDQHPGILANMGSKQEVKGDESQGTGKIAEYDVPSQDSTADSDDKPRPPLDLFQAIFLDSDSSSSSSDSSDEYDRDENDDQKKPEGAPQSELHTVQGLESSIGGGNAKKNDGVEASIQNEHASYMTGLESVDDEQVMRELSSYGNRTSGAIHRDEGKERDEEEEEEEVEEEEEEEEYGPMLPPSLDHTHKSPPKNTESQDESSTGRRKRRDREKRKEEREKKSKKRKSEHKSRDRSRDRSRDKRKDREKHTKELSSHNSKHEKIKKSKHRHGDRHKHTHHKSSKGRMQKKDASLSSDNDK